MSFFSGVCTSKARVDGKTAVITGCNTGIGKVTAYELALRGCRIVMACRDMKKAEETKREIEEKLKGVDNTGVLVTVQLNLCSLKSVRECAQQILQTESKIDLLINNAGVMLCPKELTEDGFEMQFGTNHLGHFLFTLLLLPRILKSTPARIINVSSAAHYYGDIDLDDLNWEKRSYSSGKAYCQSKVANVLFTKELAKRLEGKDVTVYSLHPGAVYTELGRHLDKTLIPGSQLFYHYILRWFMKTPEQGAQTTLHCALDEVAGQETGLYYSDCKVKQSSRVSRNPEVSEKLWNMSVELTGLNGYDPLTAPDSTPARL